MSYLLNWKVPLYTGSKRLYNIQCYINKNKHWVDRYIQDIKKDSIRPLALEDEKMVIAAIDQYEKYMPNETRNANPWTKQIVLLYILDQIYVASKTPFLISKAVQQLYTQVMNPVYADSYQHLIDFIQTIESGKGNLDELFNVEFFTVMRLPIQFFADRTKALVYAKGSESCVYSYDRKENLKLINIYDELYLSKPLLDSTEPYTDHIISYYTETTRESLRRELISTMIEEPLNVFRQDKRKRLDEIEDLKVYDWTLNQRLKTSWDDNQYIDILKYASKSDTWDGIILYIIRDLQNNQPEIWYALLQKYNIKLDTPEQIPEAEISLRKHIIQRFPFDLSQDTANYDFENFSYFFNIIYNDTWSVIRQETTKQEIEYITTILEHLNKFFIIKNPMLISQLIQESQKTYSHRFFLSKFSSGWLDYFEQDIISPKGMWTAINWLRYTQDKSDKRLSWYSIDTLLIYSVMSTRYFIDNKYQGWYCEKVYEIMIVNPDSHGRLIRHNIPFDTNVCQQEYTI